jgi:hypothetical protein
VSTIASSFQKAFLAFVIAVLALGFAGFEVYQGFLAGDHRPMMGWLLGFSVWFSAGIGMLFLIMIWHVFGAEWPVIIRRQLENALTAFPYLAVVFAPLFWVAFMSDQPGFIWHWLNLDHILPGGQKVAEDVLYQSKAAYLNRDFFMYRVVGYFVFWIGLTWLLRRFSVAQDKDGSVNWTHRLHNLSAAGLPLCAVVTTFAVFDFYMSLAFHWFSTMYGVWFFATSMRAGLAVTVVLCHFLSKNGALKGIYGSAHRYDLGSLCFAFTVFWAYISFCQYFLIYNANIPEETFWYNIRELNHLWEKNSWWWVSLFGLLLGYFFVPFIYLLIYKNKVTKPRFLFIAIWILAFHVVDLYFNILPEQTVADNAVGYTVNEFSVKLVDVCSIIGVGALCLWAYLRNAAKVAPIPLRDPRVEISIHHHE